MMRTICRAALLLLLLPSSTARAQSSRFDAFVTARGDQLYEGDAPLRFVSFNIPNLLVLEDAFEFLGQSPWRWPDEFEVNDALESVRQMGGRVARSYVLSVRREGSDMGDCVHVLGPGQFNEAGFAALDLVLKVANEKGVRVILPLVDNWKWMGGAGQYAAFRGKREQDFWTDRQLIDDFKQTIAFVVNRRNTLTGQLYRDDKAILGWETGNELDAPPAWTAEIAAYLKELDANHLVIDGRSLHGIPAESLVDPNVDVVTTHHYPASGVDVVERITTAAGLAKGRKPYFVGEVGFIPVAEARRVFEAVAPSNAAGVLYWSLRFHRREGGFYWHSEPSGGNLFKAYHWPGFATGKEYNERELLALVADYAGRLGQGAPAAAAQPQGAASPAAEAPRLLPIDHPGRISWQGLAGAHSYAVQRASSAAGPWATIADAVDDTQTQYRPLYSDASAAPGQDYFYRVTARTTSPAGAGSSSPSAPSSGAAAGRPPDSAAGLPSNVVGPVRVAHKLLVDELQDNSQIHAVQGSVQARSGDTRRVQEDIHRMALGQGGSITYRLSAGATSVSAWLFVSEGSPECAISASADGTSYTPLKASTSEGRRAAGDYDYMQPVLVAAPVDVPDAVFVRIANGRPGAGAAAAEPDPADFEISRVEISYAHQ